ncbi:putative DNA topoisomerase 2 [Podospora fimiseda]|uniref:DNA topoisomerase 2 n=1 Tax=Podospora fimiseda TaxID=252190 RepID=A0AAN7H3L5_9PEZI|nr:putative DNA topoisomerase 2 [Podospora fimiseda]
MDSDNESDFHSALSESDDYAPEVKTKAKPAPKKAAAAKPAAKMVQTKLPGAKAKPAATKKRAKPESDDDDDASMLSNTPPISKKQKKAPAKKSNGKPLAEIENDSMVLDEPAAPAASAPKAKKTATETYQKLTQLEHIIKRPDTYIGSVERTDQKMWVFNKTDGLMENRTVSYVPGLYKIFDEILVNAADNSQRDSSMTFLKVSIDRESGEITVENNGKGIPVEMHEKENCYVPELIFGHLLTGSNYNDDEKKTVGGRNGYGAKLTNIFSTKFTLECQDSLQGKNYKQVWTDNMGKMGQPKITSNKKADYVRVTFLPDYKRFGMEDGIDDDLEGLMYRRVYDMAGTMSGVKVWLNGAHLKLNFKSYAALYAKSIAVERGSVAEDGSVEPAKVEFDEVRNNGRLWQVGFTVSDGSFQQVSFVNNIATTSGGTHVNYIADQICEALAKELNKRKKGHSLKPANFRNHIFIFINCLIDNPAFNSQTKEQLTTKVSAFGSKCVLTDAFLTKVKKSEAIQNIMDFADKKADKLLAKSDGTKRSRVSNEKLVDANLAGTKRGHECTLILTEGDSARGLAVAGRAVLDPDRIGVFPLRGKMLNVRDASIDQIMKNKEIENIKKFLGLKHKQTYTDTKGLRYGHLMIMADQDLDGSHIKGLLINFLEVQFPSLLRIPDFFQQFITPVVKIWQGPNPKKPQKLKSFFNLVEYETWKEQHKSELRRWKYKYLKGLGSSSNEDAQIYFTNLDRHLKTFSTLQPEESQMLEMIFSKKKADARKEWLGNFVPGTFLDSTTQEISYSDFLQHEFILFSMADNIRSIPSMVDGLKPGQRKVMFAAFKRNLVNDQKVVEFAGYISEHAAYHHGEASLQQTIIGLAQTYIGSNNINCLEPSGNFGSRLSGGKDAASARYIHTRLSPFARRVFSKLDEPNLDYQFDDGNMIEPKVYAPVIPMVLVNGADGIGTGWSTSIPNFHPMEIVENLKRRMGRLDPNDPEDKPFVPMTPWWRGWKGTPEPEGPNKWRFNGIIHQDEDRPNEIHVTELPIRMWTDDFKAKLEDIIGSDKTPSFIKDYKEFNDHKTVHFVIEMDDKHRAQAVKEGLLEKFKLTTTVSTTNLVAFDTNGMIRKYANAEDIMEEYYHYRLKMYGVRKKYWLGVYHADYRKLKNQYRFISEIIDNKLIVSKKKKAVLVQELRDREYEAFPPKDDKKGKSTDEELNEEVEEDEVEQSARDYDYLLSMPIWSLTNERLEKLKAQIAAKKAEHDELQQMSEKDLWVKDLDDFVVEWENALKLDDEITTNIRRMGRRKSDKIGAGKTNSNRRRKDDDDYAPDKKTKAKAAPRVVPKIEPPEKLKTQQRFMEKFAAKPKAITDGGVISDDDDFALLGKKATVTAVKTGFQPDASAPDTANGRTKRAAAASKSKYVISDDSDEDFMDIVKPASKEPSTEATETLDAMDEDEPVAKPVVAKRAAAAKAKPTYAIEDSDDDSLKLEDDDEPIKPTKKAAPPPKTKSSFTLDSDEFDDSDIEPVKPAKKAASKSKSPIDDDDFGESDVEPVKPAKPAKRAAAAKAKPSYTIESDSEEEEEDEEVVPVKPGKRAAAAKAKKSYALDDESEDSDDSLKLGDVGAMVKGIGGASSSSNGGRLSLFSMSHPGGDTSTLSKLKTKPSKTSVEADEHDDTNYEALARSSPLKPAQEDNLDGFLSDDDLPAASSKPAAKKGKAPLAVVPAPAKKRGRPAVAKGKEKDENAPLKAKAAPKPKVAKTAASVVAAKAKPSALSPAAKAYAAKKAKDKKVDNDDEDEDAVMEDATEISPPAAKPKARPGRAATSKRPIVIDDEDDSMGDDSDAFAMDESD